MRSRYCMLYCDEYNAWFGLEDSKSQINNWGFDFTHLDDLSFALVSNKDDAYVFREYGDDVEKIMDDLYYDEGIQLRRMWVVSPEDKTVTEEEDLDECADEYEDEDDMDESFRIRSVRKSTIEEAFKLLRSPKKKINEDTKNSEAEFPDSFEDIVDFLKADEEEAIKGYEKALDKVEDDFVKDQLDKINTEEKAHKAYLDKVVEDPTVEYIEPLEDEDDAHEPVTADKVEKNTIEEALRELRTSSKKINEGIRDFEDKDAEEEYFRHIQELSTDYEDPNAEECDDCDEEDIEESYSPRDIYNLCPVTPLHELDEDEVDYEAIEDLENQMGCTVLGVLDSDVDELNYYYWCSDGYAYMGVPLTPNSNTYRWYSKDVNEIAELINDSEDDLDESLKEDAKFVTAATILKKEQNSIFAQPTEEGMRNMVLSILDKNKDKMKPENYNKVVKTMRSCPKKAVPSTVWTMLNPSQKVGK